MTERSNQTYSSRIAERPSLRIVKQRSMIRVMIMVQDSETLGEELFILPAWLHYRTCAGTVRYGKRLE